MLAPSGAAVAARFGVNLRRARKDAGLSQEEAGIRASLYRSDVGHLALALDIGGVNLSRTNHRRRRWRS